MFFKLSTTPGKVMDSHGAKDVIPNGCLVLFLHLSNLSLYQNVLSAALGELE